jgi:hypothetical protein
MRGPRLSLRMVPDSLLVLRWLAHQAQAHPGAILWDSDVMRAFGWSADRAQAALRALEREGCVTSRAVPLPGGASSMGDLQVSRRGQARLGRGAATAQRSVILARLRHPLAT